MEPDELFSSLIDDAIESMNPRYKKFEAQCEDLWQARYLLTEEELERALRKIEVGRLRMQKELERWEAYFAEREEKS